MSYNLIKRFIYFGGLPMKKKNKKEHNKKIKKMKLTQIKTTNLIEVGRSLGSEYRKRILSVVLHSNKPLTITEIQHRCDIPNYKNTHQNLKILEKGKFLKMESEKRIKHTEGAKVTTNPEMILKAFFNPIEKDLNTMFLVFSAYWDERKDGLLPSWHKFLTKSNKNEKKEDKK